MHLYDKDDKTFVAYKHILPGVLLWMEDTEKGIYCEIFQIHWNVFKYKYKHFSFGQIQIYSFVNIFKYNYFWEYFKYKYYSNKKDKFIVRSFAFILLHILHHIIVFRWRLFVCALCRPLLGTTWVAFAALRLWLPVQFESWIQNWGCLDYVVLLVFSQPFVDRVLQWQNKLHSCAFIVQFFKLNLQNTHTGHGHVTITTLSPWTQWVAVLKGVKTSIKSLKMLWPYRQRVDVAHPEHEGCHQEHSVWSLPLLVEMINIKRLVTAASRSHVNVD